MGACSSVPTSRQLGQRCGASSGQRYGSRSMKRTMARVAVPTTSSATSCGCLSVTSCFSGHLSRPTGCSSPTSSSIPLPRLQAGPYFGCWVHHGAAMSVAHALLFASHEDLRVHHLSHSLSSAFFADGAVAAPFRRRSCGGGLAGGAS
ncbi:Os09g0281166 [Oryza sativa Japonica Group]|uniref:Os09g0280900 protein n=1 Tax=Oryza sativa subsp. japonica TaxID=39947 RepID=A0A0P0XJY9_ORYSJ|nr:Os09g0280900 [Oryza sativa Japonica Group]BAT07224.1 Os09g0280972 [Oryza sativa Japonica Group]BAT07225.1 Os09g0281033 [Oryza sativa Japonica Group]BAT07226.1 Os09g0281166 [Oryza sativa Japonica Group]